jgi:hypothetical protein
MNLKAHSPGCALLKQASSSVQFYKEQCSLENVMQERCILFLTSPHWQAEYVRILVLSQFHRVDLPACVANDIIAASQNRVSVSQWL